MQVSVTIRNLPQIRSAFAQAPRLMTAELDRGIRKSILMIGRNSRILTPVDTGRLRASTREVFHTLYGEVGTHTNYDLFVHEGTRFMRGRPYLRRAVEQAQPVIDNIFAQSVQNVLNRIGRMT